MKSFSDSSFFLFLSILHHNKSTMEVIFPYIISKNTLFVDENASNIGWAAA